MPQIISPGIFSAYTSVRAGVSTRHGGISPSPLGLNLSYRVGDAPENVRENRRRFLAALGFTETQTAFGEQCHSATVKVVTIPGVHPLCDGLVTNVPGLGLAVSVADCVPVLLFDPRRRAVAAIHAGWRGSEKRIAAAGCSLLRETYDVRMQDIVAYVGPAAGACCYEVGEDVLRVFRPEVQVEDGGRFCIDLKEENRLQLLEAGIPAANIEVDRRCTICTADLFHSYRRDRESSGRMLACIGLRKEG